MVGSSCACVTADWRGRVECSPPTVSPALAYNWWGVCAGMIHSHLSLFLCSDGRAPEYHSIFTLWSLWQWMTCDIPVLTNGVMMSGCYEPCIHTCSIITLVRTLSEQKQQTEGKQKILHVEALCFLVNNRCCLGAALPSVDWLIDWCVDSTDNKGSHLKWIQYTTFSRLNTFV